MSEKKPQGIDRENDDMTFSTESNFDMALSTPNGGITIQDLQESVLNAQYQILCDISSTNFNEVKNSIESAEKKYGDEFDINYNDGQYLRASINRWQNSEIFDYLLSKGADPRIDNDWCLRDAISNLNYDAIKRLLNLGADVNREWVITTATDPDSYRSSVNFDKKYSNKKERMRVINLLLERGAKIEKMHYNRLFFSVADSVGIDMSNYISEEELTKIIKINAVHDE